MTKGISYMFLTGPKVVKTVTGEDVTQDQLGGAEVHSTKSGVAHFAAEDGEECLKVIRKLFSFIPQNNLEEPCGDALRRPDRPSGGLTQRDHPRLGYPSLRHV